MPVNGHDSMRLWIGIDGRDGLGELQAWSRPVLTDNILFLPYFDPICTICIQDHRCPP